MATKTSLVQALVAAGCLLCLVSSGSAQITLDRYVPTPLASDGFTLSRPERTGHLRFGALLYLEYAKDPVVWETKLHTDTAGTYPLVSDQLVLHPNVSLGLFDRLLAYAQLPINAVVAGNQEARAATAIAYDERGSLGQLRLGARCILFDEPGVPVSFGVQAGAGLPLAQTLGASSAFGAERVVTGFGQVLGELRLGRARFDLNVGVLLRPHVQIQNLNINDELTLALGASYPLYDRQSSRIEAVLEGFGSMLFSQPGGREQTPLEALAGVKLFRREGINAGVAGAMGLSAGYGAPAFRVVGMLGFSPVASRPEEEIDSDADGIADSRDRCPNEADDDFTSPDRDGCPNPDPDEDGVVEPADKCPLQAEDNDGFEDADGCPYLDNDQDGVQDSADACPDAAEDLDGVHDDDGCPDLDDDNDKVPDTADKCPNDGPHRSA
jgi:hypothetical protein